MKGKTTNATKQVWCRWDNDKRIGSSRCESSGVFGPDSARSGNSKVHSADCDVERREDKVPVRTPFTNEL